MIGLVAKSYFQVKREIDRMRGDIGRDIHIYTPLKVACTICTTGGWYDSVNDSSSYIKCPECKGTFWKSELKDNIVPARVHWTTNEAINITPGGKYFTGDAYAVIDPEYHAIAAAAQELAGRVKIDNQEMTITRINPEGAPTINRYKLILTGSGKRPE